MKKCFKVVRRDRGRLKSCVMSIRKGLKEFCRTYSTESTTDCALVFRTFEQAVSFMKTLPVGNWWAGSGPSRYDYEVWLAEAVHYEPVEVLSSLSSYSMRAYVHEGRVVNTQKAPEGSMFAFELRLLEQRY